MLAVGACSSQPQLPKLSEDAVILALGDSLTYGTGVRKPDAYPAILSTLTGHEVVNAGIPGELSFRAMARVSRLLTNFKPELMILCHGGNDLIRKTGEKQAADNIRQMILRAKQHGVSVILVAVPRPGIALTEPDFYSELAEEFGLPLVSGVLPEILRHPSLKSDGVHPNAKGYALMAEAIYEVMIDAGSL